MKKLFLVSSALTLTIASIIIPIKTDAYCSDRSGVPNLGFCTIDPDYQGGAYVCLPGGVSCDGDDTAIA